MNDGRELCARIPASTRAVKKLEAYRPALGVLVDPDDEEDSRVAGLAYRLDGALSVVGWSDVVRNAALLEAALGAAPDDPPSAQRRPGTAQTASGAPGPA